MFLQKLKHCLYQFDFLLHIFQETVKLVAKRRRFNLLNYTIATLNLKKQIWKNWIIGYCHSRVQLVYEAYTRFFFGHFYFSLVFFVSKAFLIRQLFHLPLLVMRWLQSTRPWLSIYHLTDIQHALEYCTRLPLDL